MKKELVLFFRDSCQSIFSEIEEMYLLEMKFGDDDSIIFYGANCQIVVGIYESHKLNLTTKIRLNDDQRFLGLGLISKYYNIDIDLGCENIKTIEEMKLTMEQYVKAIPRLCHEIIAGNKKEWESLKKYADQMYIKNRTII